VLPLADVIIVHIYVRVCVCVCVRARVCVYIYVYLFVRVYPSVEVGLWIISLLLTAQSTLAIASFVIDT
jgi:hypothetical protein